ncbi:MAG: hypothetical protein M0R06_07410 [Sphaerochaeta sp.]|jgi:hypothetical protein|nr:hypothetical protein [Sphaerochaeta sp.]
MTGDEGCCVIPLNSGKAPTTWMGWKLWRLRYRLRKWWLRQRTELDFAILNALLLSAHAMPSSWKAMLKAHYEVEWAGSRVPLEMWGDIIIKGRAYQSMKVHGDVRFDGFAGCPRGWMNIDGSVHAGPLAESGYGYGSKGLFNSEPLRLEMHGTEETLEMDEEGV